ncbi:MAG: pyridoxal phosphate-dependent aminotransferase [Elusimicrobia bacterium]|nr:pyridoxal phosphate-dependent aminotransferase [Elusimicrobiota bacterium]
MKAIAPGMDRISGEGAFEYLAKAQGLEREGAHVLHFEIGQPDFPTPLHIKEAAFKAINENYTGYVAAGGIADLKAAIQEEIKRTRGFKPGADQILVLPGAKPGIFFSMLALVEAGDEVLYPDPAFPTYGSLVKYLNAADGAIPVKEENEFRLDPADIKKRLTAKTKLIILNSPQNPTGSVMTKDALLATAELAQKHGVYILSDEIYSKMLYDAAFYSPAALDEAKERTLILDGFSKSYSMTGWRLGYLVGPAAIIKKMEILMINALSCTASFVQKAGIAALEGSQEDLHKMMAAFRERRAAIVKGLNEIPGFSCLAPKGAFYAFPNIKKTGKTSREVADDLLYKAGVCCLPGSAFGPGGEGYLRFSYAASVETINEAVGKIKKACPKNKQYR